jgi:hypothetical protein
MPSRIFLGGIDPQRSRQRPATAAAAAESVNFIGALGRVRLNQKLLKADGEPASRGWEPSREEEEEEESSSGSSLQQTENQCSRQPCLDGGRCRLDRWGGFQVGGEVPVFNFLNNLHSLLPPPPSLRI